MDFEAFAAGGPPELHPCQSCGRKFYQESLVRHERVCRKQQLQSKKRGVFKSEKQRLQGLPGTKPVKTDGTAQNTVKVTNWRQNHLDFVNAIRSARAAQKAIRTGAPLPPPPPPSQNPNYVPCPYCNRRFNAKAGARHIPFCQQRTRTYGEPIKSLNKRAAADVDGSKTGRGKAYYQRVIRGDVRNDNSPAAHYNGGGGTDAMYSRATFRESYSAGDTYSQRQNPSSRSFGPTTSPRRKIVSSFGSSPKSQMVTSSPITNSKPPGERPVTGSLKKHPRSRTPKGSVRFSEEVETFHMPPSPESVGVPSSYQAVSHPQRPHGNDFVSHYTGQEHIRGHNTHRNSAGGSSISREQLRQERMRPDTDNSQYEMMTSLEGLSHSSFNSSGYNSDLSPPISPRQYPVALTGDALRPDGVANGPPRMRRESSLVRTKENSLLAPFCHNCGTQYPTQTSNFCCSCGIQRAFISSR